MKDCLIRVYDAAIEAIERFLWDFRGLPYDYDYHKMLQNPVDRQAYNQAIENLRNGSDEETYSMQDGTRVTLRANYR